jgi:NADH dehydrogenase/NADH:ubiquinone oxidoreductase subunit G
LTRHDADTALNAILYIIKNFFETNVWRSLNVVSQYLGSLSTYELGFSGGIFNTRYFANSFLHLSSVNKINIPVVGESFIVYQGFYESSDYVFTKANLILPVLAYSERASTYINIEGRLRFSKRVIMTFKLLHNDFEIIKGLLLHSRNYFSHNFSIYQISRT